MGIVSYIKENGLKHTFDVIYEYKIDLLIQKILLIFLKKKPLQDIIIIESHNDFDCNGGAFYDYLIRNQYNDKYKIVWLLKNKIPATFPVNVEGFGLFKPSLKKNYYICMAKFFLADNTVTNKVRKEQKSFYLTHGAGSIKNVKGKINIPDSVDYVLIPSKKRAPIDAEQYCIPYPSERLIYVGFPSHDVLHDPDTSELLKITKESYNKVIIWMPTFRKGVAFRRNDSTMDQKMGIPLINTMEEYEELNSLLAEKNVLMIIKIHPMQDLSTLAIKDLSHIKVLTGAKVKELGVDNYRLIKCTDAMISDYSAIANEYLQLNRPIAYVLDDMNEYKLGFVAENIKDIMAGEEIYELADMKRYILNVVNGIDLYEEKRIKLRDSIYAYHDGNSCKRLADFMGL